MKHGKIREEIHMIDFNNESAKLEVLNIVGDIEAEVCSIRDLLEPCCGTGGSLDDALSLARDLADDLY